MKGEFYKMDYESWDEGTDELTLEQEAAYLRLCHQLYRRKVAIPSNPNTLARIWRCHPNKARKLLADLVAAGKVVERDGMLSNTRVTRELDERETRRTQQADAGHTGGTRTQENRRKSLQINDRDAADASGAAKRNQAEGEEEGEKKEQSEASPLPVSHAQGDFPPHAFEQWWLVWPHKVGKDAARRSFERVRKSRRVPYAALVSAVHAYIAAKPDNREFCNPATWLNQGRWQDQPAAPARPDFNRGAPAGPRLSGPTAAALARRQEMTDAPAYAPEPAVVRPFPGRRRSGPDAGADPVARDGARGVGLAGGGARDAHLDGPGTLLDFGAQRAHG